MKRATGKWPLLTDSGYAGSQLRRLKLVADLNAGARHAVVRTVAEIGMGRMDDLGDHVPMLIETITGA